MLVDGELDAVMVPNVPSSLTTHPDRVGRLSPDYVIEEKQYFRATGIFPIMHTVLIRRALCASHPWLAAEVYNAFAQAKSQALKALTQININRVGLAWVADDAARTRAVLGDRMWAYGLPASRHEVEALLRHADADGLLARKMAPEDLFDPSTHSLEDVN